MEIGFKLVQMSLLMKFNGSNFLSGGSNSTRHLHHTIYPHNNGPLFPKLDTINQEI